MELIPGFLQGVTRVLISYPFDYIRTNLQSQEYTTIRSYIKKNNLSIRNAYRGCTLPLITVPVDRSLQFFIFERISKDNSIIKASIISSIISSIYSVPVNFLSTQLITSHKRLTLNDVRTFINQSKHYTGFSADLSKSFLGSMLYTSIYGSLRKNIHKDNHNYFMFGTITSIASWSVIYPLDTIRVIKQVSNKSYFNILKTSSIKSLYSGFSIILARSVPSAGCGMVVYEKSKQLFL
jgi:hypothetical protein